jgi:hypothetical protein
MMRSLLTSLAALGLFTAAPVFGQALQVTVSVNGVFSGVGQGGSAILTAPAIGQAVLATVQVRYVGTGTASITAASISGAASLSVISQPSLPIVLSPNGSAAFTVQYLPTSGGAVSGVMSIAYTENGQASAFAFTLNGSAPDVALSYLISPGGALTNLNTGDRITFPSTNVGSSTTAVVNILNRGSGSVPLQSLTASGSDFQVTGSPAPTTLAAGQQQSFQVVFSPQATGASSGLLTVGFGGTSITFALGGTGAAPDLRISYSFADNNVHTLTDGAAIVFPAVDINATSTAVISVTNQGTGSGSLTGIFVSGAGFQLNGAPQIPAAIPSGQTVRFNLVFAPSRSGSFNGTFRIDITGKSVSGTLSASTAASNLTLSYIDPDTSNTLSLGGGSTLSFPNTLVGANSTITLLVANTGAGTGAVNSIALGGLPTGFQLVNLPPFPVNVPPSQQLRFGIRFTPSQPLLSTDTLRIDLNGTASTVNLQGKGTQAQFSYTWTGTAGATPVSPDGTIGLDETAVGQTTSTSITVSNQGLGDGQVAGISVTGQGLSLSDLPTVPFTLRPNGSQRFTLNFAPSQPGPVTGRLTIGADTFVVTATGIGSRLIYTYTSASSAVPVVENGVVIFPPLAVGRTENLDFAIQNTGTSAAAISSINLAAPSAIFVLANLPSLPVNLNPGATLAFTVSFLPNNTGSLTAGLRVNNSSFTLSGSGTQPAPLPGYSFQGPSGGSQPAQQAAIGLSLASPYPLGVQGTLKLTFVSNVFTDDPAIQFASGGRSVNFTIPANGATAMFNGGATTVALQTGTTAGNIVITPSFAVQSGFDLTPASPDPLTLAIARSAPQLLSASISAQTATSFTIVLNGYSTPRNIRQFDIQISPKQGQNFSTTHLAIDVSSTSSAWFQSATSQGFGGSFLVAIPFSLAKGNSGDDLVHLIQSLSITAANDVGGSNAVSVAIP